MVCEAGKLALSLLLQPVNRSGHNATVDSPSRVGYAITSVVVLDAENGN